MKKEKICINKSIAFFAVIAAVLLAVVSLSGLLNSGNTGSSTRASGAAPVLVAADDRSILCPQEKIVFDVVKNGGGYIKNTAVYTNGTEECNKPGSVKLASCQQCTGGTAWESATVEEYNKFHSYDEQILNTLGDAKDAKEGFTLCQGKPGAESFQNNYVSFYDNAFHRVGTAYDLADTTVRTGRYSQCSEANIEDCPKICHIYDLAQKESDAVRTILAERFEKMAGFLPATPLDCMKEDEKTGRKAGYYVLYPNGKTCGGVGTKLINGGTRNQYCGNEELNDPAVFPEACKKQIGSVQCPPLGKDIEYGMLGDACYMIKGQAFQEGTTNPYCGNKKMKSTVCCKYSGIPDCQKLQYYGDPPAFTGSEYSLVQDTTMRYINCPLNEKDRRVWKDDAGYWKNTGVCRIQTPGCKSATSVNDVKSCQLCCNEPADQAEYDAYQAAKPAPQSQTTSTQQTQTASPKYGPDEANCDKEWWCHGVCAEKSVRDMFGNDAAKWRNERAAAVGQC